MFIRKQRSKADSLLWLMMSSWKPQDKFNEHSISSKCWNSTWRRLFTHSHVLRPVLKYRPQYETTEKLCAYLAPTERRWLWSVQHYQIKVIYPFFPPLFYAWIRSVMVNTVYFHVQNVALQMVGTFYSLEVLKISWISLKFFKYI